MGFLSGQQRLGFAAALLAASALLSRLMGLLRDKIISWQYGATHEADLYFTAFVIPDIINYLLAGGFMSITLIPLLARSFKQSEEDAWRLFSAVLYWMILGACLLTLLGEIYAPLLAKLIAPGFSLVQSERLAFFMRIILPGQIFFLTGACFTALLFLRRQFAAPALSPLIYNGCIILFGLSLPLFVSHSADIGMTGYCIGVTVGAFFGAFLLPLCVALKGGVRLWLAFLHPGLKKFLFIALPLMLGQTVVMLDEQFLRIFGSMLPEGAVSLLNYGRRISQAPVSLVGQAAAVASYPFLVKLLAENKFEDFDRTLNSAFAAALAFILPLGCWMIGAAKQILGIIFEGGRFGPQETAACAPLTQIMLAPAAFWIVYMILARAFYAHEDTITPALTGTAITALCIPCYYWFGVPNGAWAVATVSGASLCIYVLWLVYIWIHRHGRRAFTGILAQAIKISACAAPPAFMAWLICDILEPVTASWPAILGNLALLGANFCMFSAGFVFLSAWIAPELLRKIWDRINRKRL